MIEGELVNLRPYDMADLERDLAWINDREVTRFLTTRYPFSRAAEEGWLRGIASKPTSYGDANFAIEIKEGRHIGNTSLMDVQAENRCATLGIAIGDKASWSKGYGADAVKTLVRFGFEEMNLQRVQLTVDARNERAQACYRKCGFVEEARLRQHRFAEGAFHDTLWMGLLRHEWEVRR